MSFDTLLVANRGEIARRIIPKRAGDGNSLRGGVCRLRRRMHRS